MNTTSSVALSARKQQFGLVPVVFLAPYVLLAPCADGTIEVYNFDESLCRWV